jgi:hypothetical protein
MLGVMPNERKKSNGAWMSLRANLDEHRAVIRGAQRFSRNYLHCASVLIAY